MNPAEDKSAPQNPGFAQLGIFVKLPLELHLTIGKYVLGEIHPASFAFALAVLCCSRYVYQKIADRLFRDFKHEFRVAGSGLSFNFTVKQTRSHSSRSQAIFTLFLGGEG